MTYGNGLYVAVGDGGTTYYSEDGITWIAGSGAGNGSLYGVAYRIDGGYDNT